MPELPHIMVYHICCSKYKSALEQFCPKVCRGQVTDAKNSALQVPLSEYKIISLCKYSPIGTICNIKWLQAVFCTGHWCSKHFTATGKAGIKHGQSFVTSSFDISKRWSDCKRWDEPLGIYSALFCVSMWVSLLTNCPEGEENSVAVPQFHHCLASWPA